MTPYLLLHEIACALLFFTVFCRLVKTTCDTHVAIRIAYWALGSAAALGMAWPFMGWSMQWFTPLITVAIVLMQSVTARYWAAGLPEQFRKR
jgi:hypothetical protein